ncbi:ABC transporter substrate-binding protein [Psychromicrobium lacuslunae]|uniref:ABC transporter substrate-binding protein n=1 Tax=Psychromicrobium lacuslunae TaxID=1618207 RepID=A0A0D4BXN7_9MICC|nr:extracellular solute-binding protein [Psychromicrobium lacuslunae]AJT41059.1 ABC transporter substrate-binding protein [Psychromicrobium lacuslunae]
MSSITRRSALALGLSAGTAALLGACSTPGTNSVNSVATIPAAQPGEKITLTYWAWLKDLQKVCDVWNAQHPLIQVEAVWTPGGNSGGYQKMYSALAAGGGPDLAQVELRSIPEFMLVNGLVDVSRYGAKQYAERYDPTLWNQVSYLDGVYGIPQDAGPMALYYRQDLFQKIGATPPTSWQDWATIAAELRKAGSYIDCFALADSSWFAALATQAGASWLKAEHDGWTINMTDRATLEVAEFFDRAIDKDLVTTNYGQYSAPWFAAAANGQIASLSSASWGDALLQGVSGASGKWRVAALPRWTGKGFGSSYVGGSTAAVFAHSKHPQEALEFAVWMTTSREGIDAMIANSGIGWSPSKDYIGAQRQQPSAFFGGQDYNQQIFLPATKQQNPDWSWWPLTQQSFEILSDGFRKKASGTSLVSSVKLAEQNIIEAFKNKGLSIRKVTS